MAAPLASWGLNLLADPRAWLRQTGHCPSKPFLHPSSEVFWTLPWCLGQPRPHTPTRLQNQLLPLEPGFGGSARSCPPGQGDKQEGGRAGSLCRVWRWEGWPGSGKKFSPDTA